MASVVVSLLQPSPTTRLASAAKAMNIGCSQGDVRLLGLPRATNAATHGDAPGEDLSRTCSIMSPAPGRRQDELRAISHSVDRIHLNAVYAFHWLSNRRVRSVNTALRPSSSPDSPVSNADMGCRHSRARCKASVSGDRPGRGVSRREEPVGDARWAYYCRDEWAN
jgi:hypothetical protein